MKSRVSFSLSLIIGWVVFAFIAIQAEAGQRFFADFDNKGIPNKDVNDVNNWIPANPAQKWGLKKAFDGDALWHTTAGCGSSGDTPLPIDVKVMESWQNYIVRMDVAWTDDDSVGIFFRQTAVDKGYLAFFGYIETPHVALADLALGCGKVGECFSEGVNCEENDDLVIGRADHGLGDGLAQDASVIYRLRVEVVGDSIKVSYGEIGKETVLIDVKDSTYASGGVGIWQESNDNGFIDNIKVTAVSSDVAVNPHGLLTTTWATIKARR